MGLTPSSVNNLNFHPNERFTKVQKRKNVMTSQELLNSNIPKNNDTMNALHKLINLQGRLEQFIDSKCISKEELLPIVSEIKTCKDIIETNTSVFISPDIDKTPDNNIYKNKAIEKFLQQGNNNMRTEKFDGDHKLFELWRAYGEIKAYRDMTKNKKEIDHYNYKLNRILGEIHYLEKIKAKDTRHCNQRMGAAQSAYGNSHSDMPFDYSPSCGVYPPGPPPNERSYCSPNGVQYTAMSNGRNTEACDGIPKEGFVSSGGLGANLNKGMDTITGPSLFTNQILQNGTTWNKLKNTVEEKGYASDGPGKLGAGPGNSFDKSMAAHIKNMEIMQAANNEYNTPQMLKEINKNINQDIAGGTNTSLYNRGAQTKGKIITLNDKAVGVLPEEFYPERAKNRNIYKTQEIIPIAGFNINEARIGENLSEIHPVLYLQRSHKRMATGAGTTGSLEEHVGKIDVPQFDAKVGRTGEDRITGTAAMSNDKKENFMSYDSGAKTGENNFKGAFKAAEGGSYWMPKRFTY